jgi:hypothetical protein
VRLNLDRDNVTTLLLIVYLGGIVTVMIARNTSITPDRFVVFLLIGAVVAGRGIAFLKDWLPFIALLLGYEMLRGFADATTLRVHIADVVAAERALFFGNTATEFLQDRFYDSGQMRWYDLAATVIYFLHFPMPLVIGFFLWLKRKAEYYQFITALLVLSFSGFLTYLLFPAAPPWYASDVGALGEVHKIINLTIDHTGWKWDLSFYYSQLNPNPVAAIPSLHAAYPVLVFLALRRYGEKLAWLFAPYVPAVWLAIVYTGEHYVVDIIPGVLYAWASYYLVYNFAQVKDFLRRRASSPNMAPAKYSTTAPPAGDEIRPNA